MPSLADLPLFALPLAVGTAVGVGLLARRPGLGLLFGSAGAGLLLTIVGYGFGAGSGRLSFFGLFSLLCLWIFLSLPALLTTFALRAQGRLRLLAGLTALALVLVALRAFVYEPRALELNQRTLAVEGLEQPVRVLLVSDVQTDRVGTYERRAFALAAETKPDLVLFSGDHIQLEDGPHHREQAALHARLLRESGLSPRLGIVAVRGDVDAEAWELAFEGTGAHIVHESTRLDLGPLVLTALSPRDSRSARPPVEPADTPHLVMGHSPDFALGAPPADLLLAGHTHGGQIRLPFFGPPLTFAHVPRDWAAGWTELPGGGWLVVSRGVGMERIDAPPVRFLCRPELVLIELVPSPP